MWCMLRACSTTACSLNRLGSGFLAGQRLSAKVAGQKLELAPPCTASHSDFFICFSSAAGAAAAGQGNYVAAKAYGWSRPSAQRPRPASAEHWLYPWAKIGMASKLAG